LSNPAESSYDEDWLAIARRDWKRVHRALHDDDSELAAFLLEQSLEKYLLARGWQLRRIHSLTVLLDEALSFDPGLDRHRAVCERISGYYLIERYPLVGITAIHREQVAEDITLARHLIRQLYPGEDMPG
jgi:HEPN domain-containing protein